MKKTALILTIVIAVIAACMIVSCSVKDGDAGPAGPAGYSVLYLQEGMHPSPSYTGSRTISVSSAFPTTTGTSPLNAGISAASGITQTLLYFPLAGLLPQNAEITAAYVTLYCNYGDLTAGGNTICSYALTSDFTGSANWNTSNGTSAWLVNAGGDYDASTAGAGVPIKEAAYNDIPVKTSVVFGWLKQPSTNHGLLLVPLNKSVPDSVYRFRSNADAIAESRPMLKIYYRLQ